MACTVKYDDGSRRTVLQHREIMEQMLGRKLLSTELVHHEDEDKRNNDPQNLLIKSRAGHINHHRRSIEYTIITCIECGSKKKIRARRDRARVKKCQQGPFCSKSCVGKWSRRKQIENGQINLRENK